MPKFTNKAKRKGMAKKKRRNIAKAKVAHKENAKALSEAHLKGKIKPQKVLTKAGRKKAASTKVKLDKGRAEGMTTNTKAKEALAKRTGKPQK